MCRRGVLCAQLFVFMVSLLMITTPLFAEKVWRVGYLEAGSYWCYTASKNALFRSLSDTRLMRRMNWHERVELVKDADFSPGWDNPEGIQRAAEELVQREDLDILFVAGTTATQAVLEANRKSVLKKPIVSFAVADAVRAGFVESETDSGVDNFTVRIVPERFKRMFEIFHEAVGFQRLGIMYRNTNNGIRISRVEDARAVAAAEGFEVVEYSGISREESVDECRKGIEFLLSEDIDAFFISPLQCFEWEEGNVGELLHLLAEKKVPTFARDGRAYIRSGALMGFSATNYSGRGIFLAENVVRILRGEPPRSLPMVDNVVPKIVLNLAVAEEVGYDPPLELLAASYEVFQEVLAPVKKCVTR